jgi:hypothetical protein
MTTPPEPRSSAVAEESCRTAFGLALRIDPRISLLGLGDDHHPAAAQPPSRVRLDEAELERRWSQLTVAPLRARELRFDDGTLLLSVDYAEPAGYLLWAREFGRVLISPDGLELLCAPDPANEQWASIVVAQALPLAATLRGLEVFHASGVVLDGRALLFAGAPGAGKSSLAAAFVRAGAQLLSDDAVALALGERTLTAHAGSAALHLRDAEQQRLSAAERTALGHPARSSTDKHSYVSGEVPTPAPLAGLFLLERSNADPAVEQLAAADPFELIASTFNLSVRTPARLQRQLDVVSTIASGGLAYRLRVQPGVSASELAALVQAQLAVMTP